MDQSQNASYQAGQTKGQAEVSYATTCSMHVSCVCTIHLIYDVDMHVLNSRKRQAA
jgi:hypothetical protein